MTNCGVNSASPYDTADDSAKIQHANDQIAAIAGGGYVYFPPDTDGDAVDDAYLAHNVTQDSHVEFYGTDRLRTFIKHFNPNSNEKMIKSRVINQTGETIKGSISAGSTVLTVNDPSSIPVGALVGVKAAGGRDPVQSTTLAAPMLASGTLPVFVNNPSPADGGEDWATLSSHRFLQVGNEVIEYSSRAAGTFQVAARGSWTPAAAHNSGATIGQARRLVAEVVSKDGDEVTLSRPAVTSVTLAPVAVGSTNMTLRGLTLDGNGNPSGCYDAVNNGSTPSHAHYTLARWVTVTDVTVRNGDDGGIHLNHGTRDSVVENSLFKDNGDEQCSPGANIFLFGGAIRNVIRDNVISGPVHFGIFVDDRSEKSTEWDSPSDQNEIRGNEISGSSTGMRLDGSSNQSSTPSPSTNLEVTENTISDTGVGMTVGFFTQGIAPRKTTASSITLNTFHDTNSPCLDNGVNNTWESNTVTPQGTDCPA